MINNTLIKLDDFKSDFRYINEEIKDRVSESTGNLEELPELMCGIFHQVNKTMCEKKESFLKEIDDIINK